jgi:hypothetical protein
MSKKISLSDNKYSIFQSRKRDQFNCVCGQVDTLSNIPQHRKYHNNPHKSEHFTYLDIRLMTKDGHNKFHWMYIPSFLKNISSEHEFFCPCKPWKKLSYEEFTKHLIKRHGGRTPKFMMRMPKEER